MMDNIVALGYGLVVFALVIGVGTVVLVKFGGAVAQCASGYSYNSTLDKCVNATGGDPTDPVGAWTNTHYLTGQLGTSGLASWVPAIIAVFIGLLFLGAFMIGKGNKTRRY